MKRVMLVDDAEALRRVLALGFELDPDFEIPSEAASMADAIAVGRTSQPDVVVVDALLVGGTSFDRLPELRDHCPGAKVVVYSAQPPEVAAAAAYRAGADLYLQKGSARELLVGIDRLLLGRGNDDADHDDGSDGEDAGARAEAAVIAHGMLNTLSVMRGSAATLRVNWERLGTDVRGELIEMIQCHAAELQDCLRLLPPMATHRVLNELATVLHALELLNDDGVDSGAVHHELLDIVASESPAAVAVLGHVVRGLPTEANNLLEQQSRRSVVGRPEFHLSN